MTDIPTTPAHGEHQRSMKTRRSVLWGERIAGGVITVGGLMVIVAVFGIMVFLVRVAAPLMSSGEVLGEVSYRAPVSGQVMWVTGDEFQTLAISVDDQGEALVFHVPTGTEVARREDGQRRIAVEMTLTAPGCGMGEVLVDDVRCKLELIPTVAEADVELVFDPPWNQTMMSEAARLETGML